MATKPKGKPRVPAKAKRPKRPIGRPPSAQAIVEMRNSMAMETRLGLMELKLDRMIQQQQAIYSVLDSRQQKLVQSYEEE